MRERQAKNLLLAIAFTIMAYAALATLALVFMTQVAQAIPAANAVAGTLPVSDIVLVPTVKGVSPAVTKGLHRRQTTFSTLVTCSAADCASGCSNTELPTEFDICLGLPAFTSVGVIQQLDEALPYGVFVGPSGCESFAQIPEINTCFNTGGVTFTDFEITE